MQVNVDAGEAEKDELVPASHRSYSVEITRAVNRLKRYVAVRSFRRDQQAHRNHGRLEKAMAFEKCLGFDLRTIG